VRTGIDGVRTALRSRPRLGGNALGVDAGGVQSGNVTTAARTQQRSPVTASTSTAASTMTITALTAPKIFVSLVRGSTCCLRGVFADVACRCDLRDRISFWRLDRILVRAQRSAVDGERQLPESMYELPT
jgi:hypothetical protein